MRIADGATNAGYTGVEPAPHRSTGENLNRLTYIPSSLVSVQTQDEG